MGVCFLHDPLLHSDPLLPSTLFTTTATLTTYLSTLLPFSIRPSCTSLLSQLLSVSLVYFPYRHLLPTTHHTHPAMSITHNKLVALESLPAEYQAAAKAAIATQAHGYSPYSNFSVGAALIHPDKSITSGCNYENCTLQSCCAERCAIVSANASGRRTATAVAVYGRGTLPSSDGTPADTLCTPCGLCRQLLVEVADLSQNYTTFDVICVSFDKKHANVMRLADMLPQKFGPGDIGMDIKKYAH